MKFRVTERTASVHAAEACIGDEKMSKEIEAHKKDYDDEINAMTLQEVTEFFKASDKSSFIKALSFLLMITSPVSLILFVSMSDIFHCIPFIYIGVTLTAVMILTGAVMLYISCDINKSYDYMNTGEIITGKGGAETAEDIRNKSCRKYYAMKKISYILFAMGIILFGAWMFFQVSGVTIVLDKTGEVLWWTSVAVMFVFLGVATFLFSLGNERLDNIDRILQEGRFTKENKKRALALRIFGSVYITAMIVLITVGFSLGVNIFFNVLFIAIPLYVFIYAVLFSALIKKNNNKH